VCYWSEIGPFEIVGNQKGILTITFNKVQLAIDRNLPVCMKDCLRRLDEYFKGRRQKFSVPLLIKGTDFQEAVWRQLKKIPFG
jgi:O6-methylguanine-DNA--protein-cysteine methyltransferase